MESIDFERILKWVLIVLVTGFIAQFGKSLAKYVMEKVRAGRATEKMEPEAGAGPVPQRQLPALPCGGDSYESGQVEAVTPPVEAEEKTQAKLQKKALKAQAKQDKKAAKKLEKNGKAEGEKE